MNNLASELRQAFRDTSSSRVRDWSVLLEAAREIERLQAECAAWKADYDETVSHQKES